jgi:hypothetical protein
MADAAPGHPERHPERCEECGFVWESVRADEVPSRVLEAAARVAARTRSVDGDVTQRPSPQRWSVLEYAGHVRDVLVHLRDRVVIALVEDNPEFKPLYRDERVDLGLYARDTPAAVAGEVQMAAALFVRTYEQLDATQLARPCRYAYPVPATRSILWMAQQLVHELEHHLRDMQ